LSQKPQDKKNFVLYYLTLGDKFRLEGYEIRDVTEKILQGVYDKKNINEISLEMPNIPTSTIYKIAKRLEAVGFIE